jgi:hypothetical protein
MVSGLHWESGNYPPWIREGLLCGSLEIIIAGKIAIFHFPEIIYRHLICLGTYQIHNSY